MSRDYSGESEVTQRLAENQLCDDSQAGLRHGIPLKRPLVLMLIVGTLLMAYGCVYVPPVWDEYDATKHVGEIEEGVTTRQQVIDRLGEPDERSSDDTVFSYEGTTSDGWMFVGGWSYYGMGYLNSERWRLTIHFDENSLVEEIATGTYGAVTTRDRFLELQPKAEGGDAEAQFQFAKLHPPASVEKWNWTCRAANQGHAKAQYSIAEFYEFARKPVERSLIQAYMWYSAAAENGYTTKTYFGHDQPSITKIESVLQQLSPEQIADAEQLVAERESDPASCETIEASASSG
jgi:hypothetical protein